MTLITETNLEKGTYAAFAAWLAFYFDGGLHPVGGNLGVSFPKAALGFAQSALPQPLAGTPTTTATNPANPPQVGITLTFGADTGQVQRRWHVVGGSRQRVHYKPVRLNFWVRCETADDSGRAACMTAASLLEAIMANEASSKPLAQCGIHRIRPSSPQPIADTTYVLRQVTCRATLRYAVFSQTGAITLPVTVPTNIQPNVRLTAAGIFEIWDTGQNAFLPVTSINGALGTGAPDNS